jgi:hypothetical protein
VSILNTSDQHTKPVRGYPRITFSALFVRLGLQSNSVNYVGASSPRPDHSKQPSPPAPRACVSSTRWRWVIARWLFLTEETFPMCA